ncbi:hypothetical protein [Metamycoplasma cloacale]|nr:hypothetical protein [Metamycoplasma cloacale]
MWLLAYKQPRTYLWANKIQENSISSLNFFIYEKKLSFKTNKDINNLYLSSVEKIWNKKLQKISNERLKNKNIIDVFYVYYIHWISWVNLLINFINFVIIFQFIDKYISKLNDRLSNDLKEMTLIIYITIFIFYMFNILSSSIFFTQEVQDIQKIINNADILNKHANNEQLKDFVLLNAISYIPNTRKSFYSVFKWLEHWPAVIKKIVLLLIEPSNILIDKLFILIEKFKSSNNPNITIHNPSNNLLTLLEKNKFELENKNDKVTIFFKKEKVEYPELFKLIHNERNLQITTNDIYFEKFLNIVLKEIYNSSIEKLNYKIVVENKLDWQAFDYL